MSDCDKNCEAVANLNDYAANLIEYSKRIDRWVNGSQTEFVDVGGVQTPTLRNLAMSIKALMGVHPDNKTIFINQDKEIYVKVAALIQQGGGLAVDSQGRLYVDVDSMNTEVFEKLMQALRLPLWLEGNMTFYVNFATGSDTLDEGRGLTAAKPFKTIQACVDYVTTNYNINIYTAIIYVANGTYPLFSAKSFQRTSGHIRIEGASKGGVIIKNMNSAGAVTSNAANVTGGAYHFKNLSFESTNAGSPTTWSVIYGVYATGGSELTIEDVSCKVIQAETRAFAMVALDAINATIRVKGGCSITGQASGESKNRALQASQYGQINFIWEYPGEDRLSINGQFGVVAFAEAHGSMTRYMANLSGITGTATGIRYWCTDGGSINTRGGGEDFFPGSSPGQAQAASYSYYL